MQSIMTTPSRISSALKDDTTNNTGTYCSEDDDDDSFISSSSSSGSIGNDGAQQEAPRTSKSRTTRIIHSNNNKSNNHHNNNFANSKNQCLGKRDKSSAGRLDPQVVEICAVVNNYEYFYTTSSCAGRCFLYSGPGIKSTNSFRRCRVSHDPITNPDRYFDLSTLETDPTGGGDPLKAFDGGKRRQQQQQQDMELATATRSTVIKRQPDAQKKTRSKDDASSSSSAAAAVWFLRFEPFILHVACRSMTAATALMAAARPTFKNVGLTTWNKARYLVAIWGDEGLDMPITTQDGTSFVVAKKNDDDGSSTVGFSAAWLADLVNERHERNAAKIDRFVQAVRTMPPVVEANLDETDIGDDDESNDANNNAFRIPRSYDVIGDVALLHSLPTNDSNTQAEIGQAIMNRNKAIKVVALRQSNLNGNERAPGTDGLRIIAGATNRVPLLTTHREYGIACIVDLHQTFFSPRMGPERLRICQQTARGENVLVLFAGVCMDALQLAARTEAASVTAVELNKVAVDCARRAHRLLERNKQGVKCPGAAERLQIIHGDCLQVLPMLPRNHYDRVVAPRPKEGDLDGDQPPGSQRGDTNTESAAGGAEFLAALLPVLKRDGGECHWYDFAADHEFPLCNRTRTLLAKVCQQQGLVMEVLHVSNAGSVAKRQLRVCADFRISPA